MGTPRAGGNSASGFAQQGVRPESIRRIEGRIGVLLVVQVILVVPVAIACVYQSLKVKRHVRVRFTPEQLQADPDTPGINGLSAGMLTHNPNLFNPVRLGREDAYTCSFNHDYTAEQKAADGGLLDKFVQATSRTGTGCATDGATVMGYYDGNTVTALWNYAQHYAMNDNSFDTSVHTRIGPVSLNW